MKRLFASLILFATLLVSGLASAHLPAVRVLPGTYQPNWDGFSPGVWLRADRSNVTLATGVSAWANLGTVGGTPPSQSTGSKQPTWTAAEASYGGQPGLDFAKANVQLLDTSNTANLSQPYTVYVVGHANGSTTQIFVGAHNNAQVGTTATNLLEIYANTQLISATSVASPVMTASVFQNTTSAMYVTNSQTAVTSGAANTGAFGVGYAIGALTNGTEPLQGTIVEVIVESGADAAARRLRLFQYFHARYGLSFS